MSNGQPTGVYVAWVVCLKCNLGVGLMMQETVNPPPIPSEAPIGVQPTPCRHCGFHDHSQEHNCFKGGGKW